MIKRNIQIALFFFVAQLSNYILANEPDSAYVFAYATDEGKRFNRLCYAWSHDGENWHSISPGHKYLVCDYGRDKSIIRPILIRDSQGTFHCLWSLNREDGALAHASSDNLVNWKRQSYSKVLSGDNCLEIEVTDKGNGYEVTWIGTLSGTEKRYSATTRDFKTYSTPKQISANTRRGTRSTVKINEMEMTGSLLKVEWELVDGLIQAPQLAAYKNLLYGESSREDAARFASLKPLEAQIHIDVSRSKAISDMLIGVFYEDINYAADGGIYAELVQNRSFEYAPTDTEGKDKNWNSRKAWSLDGEGALWAIDSVAPLHPNNVHYTRLTLKQTGAALVNEGFDGIALKAGEKYYFSLFSRILDGKGGKMQVRLIDKDGKVCAEKTLKTTSSGWKKQEIVLTSSQTTADARLEIRPQFTGTVAMDMISLFPQNTFKGRRNGLRTDLAQLIADIQPKFIRFPGGCLAHGAGLENMYRWKNTIGPLESRKAQRNVASYHQTAGLGYFEYFQFCEDIGAEPLPVVPAAVPCQNSIGGQQGGIPLCDMDDYVQEVLDLIEWANGGVHTKWGKVRAEAGHPKPFNLKYLGVGNEDLISDVFEERFTMIYNAVKEKYPEIIVIGTTGPATEGTDYEEGWDLATRLGLPMVDEHSYQQGAWFIYNDDFYDRYDRNKSKVYVGEYAARVPGGPNLESALAEALYLTNVERNGDIVSMTSYAPLLAKEGYTTWNPDLIYFTNTEVKPTVGYYVQKLYGQNPGNEYLTSKIRIERQSEAVKKRVAVSTVRDTQTGDLIIRMVNMLPVAVKPVLTIEGSDELNGASVVKYVLAGEPDDKTTRPVETLCSVEEMRTGELLPYSFTMYRVKLNTK